MTRNFGVLFFFGCELHWNFWKCCITCALPVKAWKRSQQIAGESRVAQLRFPGHGRRVIVGVPTPLDCDACDASCCLTDLPELSRGTSWTWQMSSNSKFHEKNHVPWPQWYYFVAHTGVFHNMRVPISPFETSNRMIAWVPADCLAISDSECTMKAANGNHHGITIVNPSNHH